MITLIAMAILGICGVLASHFFDQQSTQGNQRNKATSLISPTMSNKDDFSETVNVIIDRISK